MSIPASATRAMVSRAAGLASWIAMVRTAPLARALETMRLFVLIGWAIYPIGFLMARSGYGELREIVYNVADVINKVGFGLVAYQGIKAMSHREHAATT